jgi:hypothetical protein
MSVFVVVIVVMVIAACRISLPTEEEYTVYVKKTIKRKREDKNQTREIWKERRQGKGRKGKKERQKAEMAVSRGGKVQPPQRIFSIESFVPTDRFCFLQTKRHVWCALKIKWNKVVVTKR